MQGYRYQPGDRPLPHYTVQAAAGRGGFGEVYYAVSDSGREVALKTIQAHARIEMRGIAQCMNLKSPQLVTIFDMRTNDEGEHFVIMEYIAGPSLRQLIDAHPNGLGEAKAAFFLREIARGLAYLHNCGIIHRDLKPANIFFENGSVKIGDYGLAKAITTDHHDSQTVTVGTVHYMAPEIGSGRYDRSIDIYALGVLLYEMLTGHVPFRGDSPTEILMKHLTGEADLARVNEPFRSVIRKALLKDPAERYATVEDMVADLFENDSVQRDVSSIGPQDLTVVAERVGARLRDEATSERPRSGGERNANTTPRRSATIGQQIERFVEGGAAAAAPSRSSGSGEASAVRGKDPLTYQQRLTLTLITLGVVALATAALGTPGYDELSFLGLAAFTFLFGAGATLGLRTAETRLLPALESESDLLRRLATGGTAAGAGTLASAVCFLITPNGMAAVAGTIAAISATLLLLDWRHPPDREERLSLDEAFLPAIVAFVASIFLPGLTLVAVGCTVGIAFATQTLSPWKPKPVARKDEPKHNATGSTTQEAAAAPPPPAFAPATAASPHPAASHDAWTGGDGLSHHSRLAALLLAGLPMFFGICGIHRFYVGKIGTGILWLLTFGLFGIGQVIDIILIAAGVSTDAHGRRVWHWSPPPYAARPPAGPPRLPHPGGSGLGRAAAFTASLIGWLAMLGGISLGAIGILDRGNPVRIDPVAVVILLTIAAFLISLSRIAAGSVAAIFRVVIGTAGVAAVLFVLRIEPGFTEEVLLVGVGLILACLIFIAWPAQAARPALHASPGARP